MLSEDSSDQTNITEDIKPVAITSRVLRDQRRISRVPTNFRCHFKYEGNSREATVIDLSINGALLSSRFMPPIGSQVSVSLKPPASKDVIEMDAKVIRGGWGFSEHGAIGKFGVRFAHASPQLIALIPKLNR